MQLFTIDLEDWFHILDADAAPDFSDWNKLESRIERNTDVLIEILNLNNIKAVVFVLGWVAEMFPKIVEKLYRSGHLIGSHSYGHELVYQISEDKFRQDLRKSIDYIAEITGEQVIHYRAPGFSIDERCRWALEILVEEGIKYDFSLFFANRSHGGFRSKSFNTPFRIDVNGTELIEFPMSYYNFLGRKIILTGGGYFRICPKFIFRLLNKEREYNMWYIHPRDIDIRQPRIRGLGIVKNFKTYVGLGTALTKLEYVAQQYKFSSPDVITAKNKIIKIEISDLFSE